MSTTFQGGWFWKLALRSPIKTVANFQKAEEAHLFKLRLAAAWGGIRVQVDQDDVAMTGQLLSDCYSPLLYANAPEATDSLNCLSCQSPFPSGTSRCPHCGWSHEDTTADISTKEF